MRTETRGDIILGGATEKIICGGWHAPDAVTLIQMLNGLGVM